ncbi:HD-GYP domain-containing protein [Clostridium sp. DL1XJH146]
MASCAVNKDNYNNEYFLLISYVLSAIIVLIVYHTGGTPNVFANLMYIPIAITASTHGIKHSLLNSGLCGLALWFFVPKEVVSTVNINRLSNDWIVRIIIYLIIAFVIGYLSEYSKKNLRLIYEKENDIVNAQFATIYSLAKISEARDEDTGKHIERVVIFSELLAKELHNIDKFKDYINDKYIDNMSKASALHDIGKVAIPDKILLKPGKLSKEEFEVMKTHTIAGANTLSNVREEFPNNTFVEIGIRIVKFHHEKWDGSGYPYGLKGEDIPLSARIVAVVDVYDSLRSKRVYKEAFSHEESIKIIEEGIGLHFDPEIADVFLQNEKEYKKLFDSMM